MKNNDLLYLIIIYSTIDNKVLSDKNYLLVCYILN